MSEQMQADVRITGEKDHVELMIRFLDMIDLCKDGCTRTFEIFYDGDGAARLSIKFPDGRDLVKRTPESWNQLDKSKIKLDFE